MHLKLNGISVCCILGDRPEERAQAQTVRVDLELDLEETASVTDQIEDTIDYVAVAELVQQTLVKAECRMLEHAAWLVANAILSLSRVSWVRSAVTKFGAVPNLESATAEVMVKR